MAYEMRDNSGSLFTNDKKQTDKHPDSRGQAMIGGAEYWVSAWRKEGNGKKFLSLSFQRKDGNKGDQSKPIPTEEIPF